jgi:hypothetical protein
VENSGIVQQDPLGDAKQRQKASERQGSPPYPQSSPHAGMMALRQPASARPQDPMRIYFVETPETPPKRKTRPGGQPDGSSYMGAWGGWALAPNTASMGRDDRSHTDWSPKGCGTFKRPGNFFNFLAAIFPTKIYCAAARLASPAADLSDAMVAAG